jgi:hypothetical protein
MSQPTVGSRFRWNETGLGADNAVSHLLFTLSKGIPDLGLVMPEISRELAPDGAKPFKIV